MRTIGRAAALVAAALVLAAPAAAATPAAATTPAAPVAAAAATMAATTVVYGFGNYGFGSLHAAIRPDRISFGTDGTHFITHLDWSRWLGSEASATGWYYIDNCVPDCAAGHFHKYRVTMLLSHVLTQHGRGYFTGMTLLWTRSRARMAQELTWGTHGGTLAFWG
jgi:hypothetical protein